MSNSYDFELCDAIDLIIKLEEIGFVLPTRLGHTEKSDLKLTLAKEVMPIVQEYFPTWYPECGGP
jgi:hypothetical protein